MKLRFGSLILCIVFFSGCLSQPKTGGVEEIKAACIDLCKKALKNGVDLSNGPCLSDDNPDWKYKDWVCDVAHWPREDVDNLPENQCKEFRSGAAHHFVEVDPECNYIRHY